MEIIDLLPFCLVIHYNVFAVANVDGNSFVFTWIIWPSTSHETDICIVIVVYSCIKTPVK